MRLFFPPREEIESEISRLGQEIKSSRREIRRLEKQSRKFKELAAPSVRESWLADRPGEKAEMAEDRRRLVSYLGAGSVQTVRQYKFKSDLLRKRRLLFLAAVLIVVAAVVLILYRL